MPGGHGLVGRRTNRPANSTRIGARWPRHRAAVDNPDAGRRLVEENPRFVTAAPVDFLDGRP
ncbi:hypothetical protein DVZ84_04585 [Streptomyces parvulus]|uniref:Uncharacterized protein n=1 Tax=Streptomyces parvulus TaxID=146923 RepID=A0A369VC13_9ACTN|nr:hypothetical protein DVZ84_04585 [Streptomyces parvulus]